MGASGWLRVVVVRVEGKRGGGQEGANRSGQEEQKEGGMKGGRRKAKVFLF